MAQTFHITPASTFASLDPSGTGKVAFTITNASPKPLRAWPEIKPLGSTQREWLVIEGQAERSFSANEAHVFTVLINVPPGVTPGKYEFKLNVINADKADLDGCTEGPSVQFQVEAAVPTPPSNKWMWLAAAVLIVLVGAATTMLLMPSKEVKVAVVETTAPALETRAPALESKLLADVDGDLRSKGFEYEIVERRVTPDRRPPGGYIWSQDPKADQVLPKGAKLKLKIEASSVTMPDLIGMQIGESMAMLIEMRLFPKPPQVRIDPNNIDKVLDRKSVV